MIRACLPCLLALAAATATAADWPMDRCDARRSSVSPEELPRPLVPLWTVDLPRPAPAWPDQPRLAFDAVHRPIVTGRHLVCASPNNDSVVAVDVGTGRERWRFVAGGPVRLPPAAAGGLVYAGSDDGRLYALDAETGALRWSFKGAPRTRRVLGNGRLIDTWPVRGGPVVADGCVYVAAGLWPFMGVFVHALDAGTGRVVWSSSGDGAEWLKQPHGAPSFAGPAPQGALAVDDDRLLVPCGRSVPAAYDRTTGALEHFLLLQRYGGHEVAAAGRRLYVNGGAVFDLDSGLALGTLPASPAIDGDAAYAMANGVVSRFDLAGLSPADAKGKPASRWKPGPTISSAPFKGGRTVIRAGSRLYAGGLGRVAAYALPLAKDARPEWEAPVEGTVAVLLVGAGRLFAVTEEGRILCYGGEDASVPDDAERPAAPAASDPDPAAAARAKAILDDARPDGGYALVLGADEADLGRVLARSGPLHVVILEEDPAKAGALRRALLAEGLYGGRLAVVEGSLVSAGLPPCLFSVAVVGRGPGLVADAAWCRALFEVLHPYRGTAYLAAEAVTAFTAGAGKGLGEVSVSGGLVRLARRGGLPGAGSWTHEHADAANTRVSRDTIVKAPLGLLWFGGESNAEILPRHGHGPQPQVLDGRLVVEGMNLLRAIDVYTGRVLWEADLPGVGSHYDTTLHQPGANATGGNFVMAPDGVYVAYGNTCLRLDPVTGRRAGEIPLPEAVAREKRTIWGYLSAVDDVLVCGAAVPTPVSMASGETYAFDDDDDIPGPVATAGGPHLPRTLSSRHLFVLERATGRVLWSVAAEHEFRHNAVCAGGGRLYVIDRELPPSPPAPKKTSQGPPVASLKAFDLRTGRLLWRCDRGVFGTWLSWSAEHDILVESGREAGDTLRDEPRGMRGWRAADGTALWHDVGAGGPAMIHGETVIHNRGALQLLTGRALLLPDPVTGLPREWRWARQYGCNTPAGAEHLLTFRSGAAGFYDLARRGGTGNFGGARSGCSNNLVVAGGLLVSPEYTRTCSCSYPIQVSYALRPDPEAELWTFQGSAAEVKDPVRRIGINLGAPGDRVDDAGTLWIEYPDVGAPSPKLRITSDPGVPETFRRHATTVEGPLPWVAASGVRGLTSLTVGLNGKADKPRPFTVRLTFAEPDGLGAGERIFDVYLQGHRVAAGLDIAAEAGSPGRSLVREYAGILAGAELNVGLRPAGAGRETVLCGVELVREGN